MRMSSTLEPAGGVTMPIPRWGQWHICPEVMHSPQSFYQPVYRLLTYHSCCGGYAESCERCFLPAAAEKACDIRHEAVHNLKKVGNKAGLRVIVSAPEKLPKHHQHQKKEANKHLQNKALSVIDATSDGKWFRLLDMGSTNE